MALRSWLSNLFFPKQHRVSFVRNVQSGSLYRVSDLRGNSSIADIHTRINTMRALARDSQISTALSYYATDATITNSSGDIIWATAIDSSTKDVADIVNGLFKRWNINAYAREHILELATIGNLYLPTTEIYKTDVSNMRSRGRIALDNNTIPDTTYDIIPSYKIPPEDIVHLWYQGLPEGYVFQPEDGMSDYILFPESSVIHFSLGGLLGDFTLDVNLDGGDTKRYDIQFATPLMSSAVQPTQTLSLLEDALLLSSLIRTVKFINVECGNAEEEEIDSALQMIKDAIEQQLAINTNSGDAQSFVNPQSPNNLIYLPKINGQDAISITDLNMAESTEQDSKLLNYYQDKKLSVLGVPKEAMNFSSNEGLGGAGTVLSQRSALYANALQRLETAYMAGWTDAINKYFIARNMSGFVNKFTLHMNPIITPLSTVLQDKKDSALSQASTLVSLLKELKIKDSSDYNLALSEILGEIFPNTGAKAATWNIDLSDEEGDTNGF